MTRITQNRIRNSRWFRLTLRSFFPLSDFAYLSRKCLSYYCVEISWVILGENIWPKMV